MAGATPAPIDAPRRLVITGPYRRVRNPMYWGVLLVLLGETIFFESVPLLRYTAFFFLVFHGFVVLVEEPGYREIVGEVALGVVGERVGGRVADAVDARTDLGEAAHVLAHLGGIVRREEENFDGVRILVLGEVVMPFLPRAERYSCPADGDRARIVTRDVTRGSHQTGCTASQVGQTPARARRP